MPTDIEEALSREADRLTAELAQNPTYRRLQKVRGLLSDYELDNPVMTPKSIPPTPTPVAAVSSTRTRAMPTANREGSKTQAVVEAAARVFAERGTRASSGTILPDVLAAGILLGGKVPSKTLSSYLSNSKRFNNVKDQGYGLAEWGNSPGPKAKRSQGDAGDLLENTGGAPTPAGSVSSGE